jgi:RND family efflux transporter MFP subunit
MSRLRIVYTLAGLAALAGLIAYSGGFLTTAPIQPGRTAPAQAAPPESRPTAHARRTTWPLHHEAVGTVRPRTETKVEAQVSGRVLEVLVTAGDRVKEGRLLVRLDDSEYQARLEQARQELAAAEAALTLARREYGRLSRLLKSGAAPKRDVDRAQERLSSARAAVRRVGNRVEETRIALSHTRIQAPEDGQVTRRLIEPGDLALPGRPLVVLQTGGALRLEALVREGLIRRVGLGQELTVAVPSLETVLPGEVEEIVPAADPATRTFLVKVLLPDTEGLYPGMFGRLLIPAGREEVVLIPAAALVRVGQLETVLIRGEDGWQRVYVTTGQRRDGMVEVLSGLKGGETVAVAEGADGR